MTLLASVPLIGRLIGGSIQPLAVRLSPVPVHAVETSAEKRPRTLKHLLRGNHANHALLQGPQTSRYNHMAHALCAAYLLGASSEGLNHIYDGVTAVEGLTPWAASPAEIANVDWRDFLGDTLFQRAYVDFFEDVLASHSVAYSWRRVVELYMLGQGRQADGDIEGDAAQQQQRAQALPVPLVGSIVLCGLGHPLIHLAYAFEMDSRVLAMEALALAAVSYDTNVLQRFSSGVDSRVPKVVPVPAGLHGVDLPGLLNRAANDKRFDGVTPSGTDSTGNSFDTAAAILKGLTADSEAARALLEYWSAWDLTASENRDLTPQLRSAQEAAVALLVATVAPGTHSYHALMCHVLATSHAMRVLLPNLPTQFHGPVLHEWWLLALSAYIAVGRPPLDPDFVPTDRKGKGWSYVEEQAVSSRWSTDAHYVQALRAITEASHTWGDIRDRYLNAAVRFVDDFEGWVEP